MFKFIDNLFSTLAYFVLVAILLIVLAVSFHFFPMITGILLICFLLSKTNFEKKLKTLSGKIEQSTNKLTSHLDNHSHPQRSSIKEAFKNGFHKGYK